MPVKEPPVTTTVAIPGAKVEEASQVALSNLKVLQSKQPLSWPHPALSTCRLSYVQLREGLSLIHITEPSYTILIDSIFEWPRTA